MRRPAFLLICALGFAVAAYAVAMYGSGRLGDGLHPDMRASFRENASAIRAHIFASTLALVLGPFQFSARLRARRPGLHRWTGRVYLGVGVAVGGGAGLYMSLHALGGLAGKIGFGCLALAWLYTGARGYAAARARDFESHRRWMTRSFALTFAAVTLRLYLPAAMVLRIPFEAAYPAIAWLCWVPNLLVAEWLLRGRNAPSLPVPGEAR